MKMTETDIEILREREIPVEKLEEQLRQLHEGFPYLKIERAATVDHGISAPDPDLQRRSLEIWEEFLAAGGDVVKMVPASGAASRMFKDLYTFLGGKKDKPDNDFIRTFFDRIEDFAFFPRLNWMCLQLYDKSIDTLIKEKRFKDIVRALLEKEGLNYGSMPKALLQFHKITGSSRTPLEEHLAEAAQYGAGRRGKARVHFTLSPEHLALAAAKVEETAGVLARKFGVEFEIESSIQKPSTDTVAMLPDGTPYREDGKLFFRPGGHGALIHNLSEIDADVVFIKNIDNVVPDEARASTIRYKKIIGGILVAVKQKADSYCRLIRKGNPSGEQIAEMLAFLREVFDVTHDKADEMDSDARLEYIYSKLNRPTRVCGMVRNEGEPGGGPFLVYSPDGTVQPQILESTQIDPANKEASKMLESATHFNPVDLVCAIKDWEGNRFDLERFVDPATGFISEKSRNGIEFKALELPGLWNGAMADWNTIFIEVPADTFNPVKTVNDLLRSAHQPL